MTEDEQVLSLTCAGAFRKATTADSYWDAFFMYLVGLSAIAIVLAVLLVCAA